MVHSKGTCGPVRGARTASEALFEQYLAEQAIAFEYELTMPGRQKRPDYRISWDDVDLFCEVKELHARQPRPDGAACFDPYGGIRKEIHEARRQFKEYKESPCVLVIHNVDDWEFRDRPYVLFGAMLGDLGIQAPFDERRGIVRVDQMRSAFLGRGKMVDPKSRRPQNTTISAIAVLSELDVPNPEFEQEYRRRIAALDSKLGVPPTTAERVGTRLALYRHLRPTAGRVARVEVFKNPYARTTLPDDVLDGPYDTRFEFNVRLGRIVRVTAGQELQEIEAIQNGGDIVQRIEQFSQAIIARFSPQRIVLFGSHAYGCPEPDSDVDILVVFAGNGNATDRSLEIRKRLPCDFPLDLLTRSTGEINRRAAMNDSFILEILKHGKVLYEASRA